MNNARGQKTEGESEERKTRRKASEVQPVRKELIPEAILPPKVEAQALTDSRFSYSANRGRKAQVVQNLQRTHGNAFVQRLMAQGALQQKEGKESVPPDVAQLIEAARGGGKLLEPEVRAAMEAGFGQDFGEVRVHADAEADRLAGQLGARAFTTGKDVFFREGAYEPYSEAGRQLLGHELTHVVQQSGNTAAPVRVTEPSEPAEREAEAMGQPSVPERDIGIKPRAEMAGAIARDGPEAPAPAGAQTEAQRKAAELAGRWQSAWFGLVEARAAARRGDYDSAIPKCAEAYLIASSFKGVPGLSENARSRIAFTEVCAEFAMSGLKALATGGKSVFISLDDAISSAGTLLNSLLAGTESPTVPAPGGT